MARTPSSDPADDQADGLTDVTLAGPSTDADELEDLNRRAADEGAAATTAEARAKARAERAKPAK